MEKLLQCGCGDFAVFICFFGIASIFFIFVHHYFLVGTCISRSAKDEFNKSFVSVSSPFADRCTIVGEDIDFILKMKAVKRSQNVRKHLRTFSQEHIITVTTADEMAEVARLFS